VGSKNNMLRKFLIILGFASILFGVLSFAGFIVILLRTLNDANIELGSGWEKYLYIIGNLQISASNAVQEMAVGGICLYLSHKIKPFGDKK
jgi:hypothetical protein